MGIISLDFNVISLSGLIESAHFLKRSKQSGISVNVTGFLLLLISGIVFVTSPPTETIPKSTNA